MGNKPQIKYILPNLFTASSIFIAVISVIYAHGGRFSEAAWLIVLASIFDALDGRVARMTNTTSEFGVEFDSLADVVSFGFAPAMLYFFYTGQNYGKIGVFIAAMFVILGAVRLARFNITKKEVEPNIFIGLPIPAAALAIVGWVLLAHTKLDLGAITNPLISVITFCLAVLMVSNIRYPSFKKLEFENKSFIKITVLVIFVLGLIYIYPVYLICGIFSIFALFGPARALVLIAKKKKLK